MKTYGCLILNVIILICSFVGQLVGIFGLGNFMQNGHFLYYTNMSNILVFWVSIITIIYEVKRLKNGEEMPAWVYLTRFISTAAISLTFLVFAVLLTPTVEWSYLLSFNNLFVHNLVPILAIIDWCIYGRVNKLGQGAMWYGLLPPLCYLFFVYIRYAMDLTIGGNKVPYFFLDFEQFGWFSFQNGGMGVMYWIISLTIVQFLLSFCLFKIAKRKSIR